MRFIFLLLLFFILQISFAQNLVPNPSFEEYKILPCQMNSKRINELINYWVSPIPSSPDYWNLNSNIDCDLNAERIKRFPKSGSGMIGLITGFIAYNETDEYKEYVEIKLNKSLELNKLYCGEFYVKNRNLKGDRIDSNVDILEINNLSLAFSEFLISYPITDNSKDYLLLNNLIKVKSEKLIPANNDWHKIEGCFKADKNYEFLLIGNFNSIDSTDIIRKTFGGNFAQAYYFIDDVSLIEMPYAPPALENEITFCHTESHVLLDATSDGATGYTWPDGSTSPTLLVSNRFTDTYNVSIAYGNYTYKHKFKVIYIPDVELGADTLLCDGESISLKVKHTLQNFQWNDLSTANEKLITSPGQYWINFDSTCPVRDTITVSYIKCPGFIPNIITPNGDDKNEKFTIENISNRNWSLQVFNRWGNKVYEQAHYTNNWRGENQNPGVYYYVLYCESLNRRVKGWFHIVK